jgi:hypothetical protein
MPVPNKSVFGFVSWWLLGTLLIGGVATGIVVLMCVASGTTVTEGIVCALTTGYGGPPLGLSPGWQWVLMASLYISALSQLLLIFLFPAWILLATWRVYVGARSVVNR